MDVTDEIGPDEIALAWTVKIDEESGASCAAASSSGSGVEGGGERGTPINPRAKDGLNKV